MRGKLPSKTKRDRDEIRYED